MRLSTLAAAGVVAAGWILAAFVSARVAWGGARYLAPARVS